MLSRTESPPGRMTEINSARLKELVARAIGPAPWYWQTFPVFNSASGQRFVWTHHGQEGPLGYLVSLGLQQELDKPRLALNSYCRPFLVPSANGGAAMLGIWCPEGRALRLTCFNPDQLKTFDLAEVAGWFKQSSDRIYAGTAPVADFDVPLALAPGTHKIDVPRELQTVDELIVPTSYP